MTLRSAASAGFFDAVHMAVDACKIQTFTPGSVTAHWRADVPCILTRPDTPLQGPCQRYPRAAGLAGDTGESHRRRGRRLPEQGAFPVLPLLSVRTLGEPDEEDQEQHGQEGQTDHT